MSVEKFEERTLTGPIKVACKFDDGSVGYWEDNKENIILQIRRIVSSYSSQGYILTLRQLHYQFVSKDMKYVNHQTAYKKLGSILDDCRYAGLIDWGAIEDRGRVPFLPYWVNGVDHALQDTIDQYRVDRQKGQENHIEVWTEKDALSGIFRRSTVKYHVRLVVNKGYTSSSAAYGAYKRFATEILNGRRVVILYFGDHDPSGLDMIRDIKERLLTFLSQGTQLSDDTFMNKVNEWWDEYEYTFYDMCHAGYLSDKDVDALRAQDDDRKYKKAWVAFDAGKMRWYLEEHDIFQVIPIGLTMEQIKQYNLPPNPTKMTDTRSDGYIKQFGRTCWEVDALDARVLTEIIEENIQEHLNIDQFNEMIEVEKSDIETLKKFINKN